MNLFYLEKILVHFEAVSLHSYLAESYSTVMTKGVGLIFRLKYLKVDVYM